MGALAPAGLSGDSVQPMYDLIGDIHGHASELTELLGRLGYRCVGGVYEHPSRRAVFLGDFIDRGPRIAETLAIVRPMVEAGAALAVMGNHEFNALAFHTPDRDRPGEYLRPHVAKNVRQHQATLDQLSPAPLAEALEWFRTLPLSLELAGVRAVHACWDEALLATIASAWGADGRMSDEFLQRACDRGDPLFAAVDATLKGKEIALPAGLTFVDKDGHRRDSVRARWYLSPAGHTYRTYALQSDPVECDEPLDGAAAEAARPYPANDKPAIVGHYWLRATAPATLADNVACVDYSVAKGGMLCAYRWDGESTLSNQNFVSVAAR